MSVSVRETQQQDNDDEAEMLVQNWKKQPCHLDSTKTNKDFYGVTGIVNSQTYSHFECRKLNVNILYCIHGNLMSIHASMTKFHYFYPRIHALCFQIIHVQAFSNFMNQLMQFMQEISNKPFDGISYKFVYT